MVCIGKGVRPNVSFLNVEDLRVDLGVVVDGFTACSSPNVHAAGDVAVTFDPITGGRIVTGLWTNAVDMGRCAGYNMAGRPTQYGGTFGILNATQVADVAFVSMGMCTLRSATMRLTYRLIQRLPKTGLFARWGSPCRYAAGGRYFKGRIVSLYNQGKNAREHDQIAYYQP